MDCSSAYHPLTYFHWRNSLKRVERHFELKGPEGLGAKPRPGLIGPVLTRLQETLQDSVRMGFLHSSRASGRIPQSLRAAAEVRYLGHRGSKGRTVLRFEIPTFGEVAKEFFEQQSFWEHGQREEQTAFDLLSLALHDVRTEQRESSLYDSGMLKQIGGYHSILEKGLDSIVLPGRADLPDEAFDAPTVAAAVHLGAAVPPPRRVRVAGRLDVMGASQSVLKLHVRPGVAVTALWHGREPIDAHRDLFNREVVVEGMGVFRPSGSLLRIDAEAVAAATVQDDFFRKLPTAVAAADIDQKVIRRPGEKSAFTTIYGAISSEESDEEFAALVQELS